LSLPTQVITVPWPESGPSKVIFASGSSLAQGDQASHWWKSFTCKSEKIKETQGLQTISPILGSSLGSIPHSFLGGSVLHQLWKMMLRTLQAWALITWCDEPRTGPFVTQVRTEPEAPPRSDLRAGLLPVRPVRGVVQTSASTSEKWPSELINEP